MEATNYGGFVRKIQRTITGSGGAKNGGMPDLLKN